MFSSRGAVSVASVASRQIPGRAARALSQPAAARLYSTESAAAPASTTTTATAAAAAAPTTDAPSGDIKPTVATRAKPVVVAAPSKWVRTVTPAKPAPAPFVPATKASSSSSFTPPRSSPTVYQPKAIAYEAPTDSTIDLTTIPRVDWANSFHGISTRPVTEKQFKILMQPVEEKDIEVKPDGIIYLPEIKYRRRLNEAFGPMGWGLIPKGDAVVGDTIVTREYALIVDGRFVSQAQGENGYFSPDQLPSAVEGCKSNALMRCCKDLGIGSELWDPHFVRWFKKNQMEEVWVEHATTKKKRTFWYRKGEVEVQYPYRLTK